MDMESSKSNLKEFKNKVSIPVYEISALNGEGLDSVLIAIADILDSTNEEPLYDDKQFENHVLYTFKKEKPYTITKEDNTWVIRGEQIEKLFKMTKFSSNDATIRFTRKLKTMGVDDKLKELGAENGDTIRILNYEFTYIE
jgi:GTP-binding protein